MNYFYSNKALLFLAISSFVCTAVQASQPDNPRPTKRRKLSSNKEQLESPQANTAKAVVSQQSLAQHKRKIFQCTHPGCPKKFSQKGNMKQHVQAIHEGRRHQCTQCDKTFSQKSSMKQHVKAIHEGRQHQCTQCDKTFSQKSSMKQHVKAIHEGRRHQCTQCDKTFVYPQHVNRHVKAIHQQDHAPLRSSTKRKAPSEQPDQHLLDIASTIASLSNSNNSALQELAQEKGAPVTMIDLFPFHSSSQDETSNYF